MLNLTTKQRFALLVAASALSVSQSGNAGEKAVLNELRTTHRGCLLEGHFFNCVPALSERRVNYGAVPSTISCGEMKLGQRTVASSQEEIERFIHGKSTVLKGYDSEFNF